MPILSNVLISFAAGAATLGTPAQPDSDDPFADLVIPSVAAEMTGVKPGGTVWVGVHFEIKDGWHTYWPGQNDTGFGTKITAAAPEGVRVGEARWPAPKRYLAPGDILDHVHEGGVTALIPVEVSDDTPIGTEIAISFDLEWLVCDDVCIPGWETVSLTLPVVEHARPAAGEMQKRFSAARARVPMPNTDTSGIEIVWDGPVAEVRIEGTKNLSFYPDEGGSRVENLSTTGTTSSGVLRLSFDQPEPVLSGVLEIHGTGDDPRLFAIRSERVGED